MVALIITLTVVGLILLIVELILIPGFGVAGILGGGSLVVSCYLGFSQIGPAAGAVITAAEIVLTVSATMLVLRSKTWKKASLGTSIDSKVDISPEEKGMEVGQKGVAATRLALAGQVKINGNLAEAFARDSVIEAGAAVEIIDIQDNKIFVKEIANNS